MSLFGKLIQRIKSAGERNPRELEEDSTQKEVLENAEEELFGEEEDEDDEEGEEEDEVQRESEEGQKSDGQAEDPDTEYEIVEREILPAKIICPDCGGITLEGLDLCDKCGGELY